jgi:hypothetical protein
VYYELQLKFTLNQTLKYPDQALTEKLAGISIQSDFHFLLQLKAVTCINPETGKFIPFNSFKKQDVKTIADLMAIKRSTFYTFLNKLILRGWITKHSNSYNLISINKINKQLNFEKYTHKKKQFKYHSYRKLNNIQGIDLTAHRIQEIILLKNRQFRYIIENHPQIGTISSAVNQHLIDQKETKKAKRFNSYFGMSIDSIVKTGGYDSKKFVWSKLNQMETQGFKIKKDTSKFDRNERRDCNLYDMSFNGTFLIGGSVKPVTKKVSVKAKKTVKTKGYNSIELMFNTILNSTENRLKLIEAGVLSKSYLKFTKENVLVSVPKIVWSNLLVKLLNNDFFKPIILSVIGKQNIRVSQVERSAMFTAYNSASERFGSVFVNKIQLVVGNGNYNNQPLLEYKSEVNRINSLANIKPVMNDIATGRQLYNIYNPDPSIKWY